ncbi:MAG: IleS, partial [Deltaproteobacteria bacterium]|nr:IleS [Deltaproteobacteria bacterium]
KTLNALVRLMSVILSFTAEEVWERIPGAKERAESVHFTLFPEVESQYLDPTLEERFELLLKVRAEVSRVLESARQDKRIGNSLEASVTLSAPEKIFSFLRENESILKELFIVSEVLLSPAAAAGAQPSKEMEGLNILVSRAGGQKCPRCWMFDPKVGEGDGSSAVCPRCEAALAAIQAEGKA